MRKLVYSMTASLDGYVVDRDGSIDWAVPDEELHRFHNDRIGQLGGHILGRRLYEVMSFWETVDDDSNAPDHVREFARAWKQLPKYVFSRTLTDVEGSNTVLLTGDIAEEIARLKSEPGRDLEVGGASLAGECMRHGLIDDIRLFVSPTILGGGVSFFPPLEQQVDLELVETRTFGDRVVYLRYLRA